MDNRITNLINLLGCSIGVFVFCWVSPQLLDNTYLNRLVGFSCIAFISFAWLIFKSKLITIGHNARSILIAITLYFLLQFISMIWAENSLLLIYDVQKTILLFAAFILGLAWHTNQKGKVWGFYSVAVLAIIYQGVFYWQLSNIDMIGRTQLYGLTSLSGHKNLFSSFTLLLIILLAQLRNTACRKQTICAAVIITISLVSIGFAQSRSVLLGLTIGSLIGLIGWVTLYFREKSRYWVIILLVLVSTVSFSGLGIIPDDFFSKMVESESAQERIKIWHTTLSLVNQDYFLGKGAGNWPLLFPSGGLPDIARIREESFIFFHVHNEYLKAYFELGILGVLLFILPFAQLLTTYSKQVYRLTDWFSPLILASLIAYMIVMFFDFPNSRPEHMVLVGLILAGASCNSNCAKSRQTSVVVKRELLLVGIICICFSIGISALRINGEILTTELLDARKEGKHENVIELANRAENPMFTFDNTLVPLTWYAGNAHQQLGELKLSVTEFQRAYSINPYNHHVLNNFAVSLSPFDEEKAEKLLKQAIRINPDFEEAKENLMLMRKNE
jgi:O-antigen ligase